jgi:hypothetical protein
MIRLHIQANPSGAQSHVRAVQLEPAKLSWQMVAGSSLGMAAIANDSAKLSSATQVLHKFEPRLEHKSRVKPG